jgi:hypothetical protein
LSVVACLARDLFARAFLAGTLFAAAAAAGPAVAAEDTPVARGQASILLPAHAFDRGNVRVLASESYADDEPVIVNGGAAPNFAEYDVDFPVSAQYALHVRYAAAEVRPVDVFLDGAKVARGFTATTGSWQSSSAAWEKIADVPIGAGKRTLKLQCPGPCIPHIVALRLDSPVPFPAGWKLERPGARKLDDRLGALAGHDPTKDGFEAFVREDGSVDVPDEYNPIVRFARRDPQVPMSHRVLEYALLGPGRYTVEAAIAKAKSPRGDGGWEARLSVKAGEGRVESAALTLSEERLRKMLERASKLIGRFREAGEAGLGAAEREAREIGGSPTASSNGGVFTTFTSPPTSSRTAWRSRTRSSPSESSSSRSGRPTTRATSTRRTLTGAIASAATSMSSRRCGRTRRRRRGRS